MATDMNFTLKGKSFTPG